MAGRIDASCLDCGAMFPREEATSGVEHELAFEIRPAPVPDGRRGVGSPTVDREDERLLEPRREESARGVTAVVAVRFDRWDGAELREALPDRRERARITGLPRDEHAVDLAEADPAVGETGPDRAIREPPRGVFLADIREATRNALSKADELGCESLVIPALGCGVAGFDLREGARIVAEEIDVYEPRSLEDIRFIVYSDEEHAVVESVADAVTSNG
ncbi:MAG: macro domain-containing protein [Halalkalicoccus sp.]